MILIEWQPFESGIYLRKYSSSFTLTTTTVYVTVINVRRCTLKSDCRGHSLLPPDSYS